MSPGTAGALLTGHVRRLVEDGTATAAAGTVIRGPDRAAAAFGHHGRPGGGAPPAGPGTLFALGSLTKTFTALLLAEMAGAGLVAYDDPIETYLPPGAGPRPGPSPITLADLATHSGGLPRLPLNLYPRALPRFFGDPYAGYGPADLYRATARLRQRPAPRPVRYSTFGVGLLGQLLANAADAPWHQLLTTRVLAPLGLTGTTVPDDADLTTRTATGHRRGRPVPHWRFDALAGAGALYSSATDLQLYLTALLDPATAPPPLADALTSVRLRRHPGPRPPDHKTLGWDLREVRGRTLLWHTGGTGGFTSYAAFSPDAGTAVAVVANTTPGRGQPVLGAGRRLFREVAFG
ncbi:serine hydrolase domain-containing protein [Streptomyces yaizuensis]|uniref:Serine hydrolase n=1 Tax=Streptomyces yaizuensis TaxID=2989713 RepID=A0ABQ5NTY9_9ACTN|nr:serine hydrolase domain-containing protein [Streptomyces sp. YSPA8]GLF93836.1 serine hydrolase [Streptomyces sp. YSPA8]